VVLAMAVVALLAGGCGDTECGPGTVLRGGECQPVERTVAPGDCACAAFTHWDPAEAACVADYPETVCDPDLPQQVTDAGLILCGEPIVHPPDGGTP